ncbi:hypothetical protein RhiirA5_423780 [Rhizophagus irregularis]|uniref:BED-type domain-containing protein n=1 Tax=Rhizophagus irregularis TaxID=588596 RepID=A0A2N0P996_9GLOM|nr:hypothetical protein RhiirA5_423780 [Rhizophagus irregularis]
MPPASPIWAHFNKLGHVAGFQQARAQCKYCNYEVNAAANKCIAHLKTSLSTTLLDDVYDNTKNEMNELINSANNICLISDGWSNMMQEHWTNYIITTPRPVFFSAHQTGEIKQTGENIVADIDNIISQIDHSKLAAIITDNASSMKKA